MKRNTMQRNLVLEAVNNLGCHATADEIYEHVVTKQTTISRSTVYRNLKHLVDTGEISKVAIPNGADLFDHLTYKHYHAKCIRCGKLIDVKMDYMENLEEKITDTDNFMFYTHDIIFKGLCKNCQ
ncbi:MAG: Fur family transcriptional regulator [Anaerotignaceae bacterium]